MLKRVTILTFFLTLGGYIFLYTVKPQNTPLISPLIPAGRFATNLWFPKIMADSDNIYPQISAKSAYFIDTDTGEVLYQKKVHDKLPIASLTKIMTAIVSLENKKWGDEVSISSDSANMEPDHMELRVGEKLNVEELMYGIFLVSANDAAVALAESIGPNKDYFVQQMNEKAKQLDMKDTLFINPTGLEEDGKPQYSTVYDVALMSRYLIKNYPHVLDISSTPHIVLSQNLTHQDYDLYSGINLLTTYPGVLGLKTGFTPEAGLTIVTVARRGEHQVLGVILNSEDRRGEAKELLDYSFKKLGVQI